MLARGAEHMPCVTCGPRRASGRSGAAVRPCGARALVWRLRSDALVRTDVRVGFDRTVRLWPCAEFARKIMFKQVRIQHLVPPAS